MMLHIAYQNVRGLRTKLTDFKMNLDLNNYDIVFITETWLKDCIFDTELINTENYFIFRRDRSDSFSSKKDGGCVLIAVRYDYTVKYLSDFNSDAEDLWLLLTVENVRMYLCCIYLPPGDDYASSSFVDKLEANKGRIQKNVLLLCGDFNCSSVNWVKDELNSFLIPLNVETKYSRIIDT